LFLINIRLICAVVFRDIFVGYLKVAFLIRNNRSSKHLTPMTSSPHGIRIGVYR